MLDHSAIPVPSGRQPPTVYNQVESRCRRLWAQKVKNDGYHPPIASRTERRSSAHPAVNPRSRCERMLNQPAPLVGLAVLPSQLTKQPRLPRALAITVTPTHSCTRTPPTLPSAVLYNLPFPRAASGLR
jgi:hypothetical protein